MDLSKLKLGVAKPAPVAVPATQPVAATAITLGVKPAGLRLAVAPPKPAVVAPAEPVIQHEAGTPASFKAKLDRLDAMMIEGQGIDQIQLDTARAYVGSIMMELKANPELDPLMVARDVHNVMKFIQSSTSYAAEDFKKKKVVAEAKAVKKGQVSFDLSGLGDVNVQPQTATQVAVAKAGLIGLGKMNLDSIGAKMNKERK